MSLTTPSPPPGSLPLARYDEDHHMREAIAAAETGTHKHAPSKQEKHTAQLLVLLA